MASGKTLSALSFPRIHEPLRCVSHHRRQPHKTTNQTPNPVSTNKKSSSENGLSQHGWEPDLNSLLSLSACFVLQCSRHGIQKVSAQVPKDHGVAKTTKKRHGTRPRFHNLSDTCGKDWQVSVQGSGTSEWDTWKQLERTEDMANSLGKHPNAEEHTVTKTHLSHSNGGDSQRHADTVRKKTCSCTGEVALTRRGSRCK